MPITKDELQNFIRFAEETLKNGGVESLVELACLWESKQGENWANEDNCPIPADEETIRKLAKWFPEPDNEQLQRAFARRGGVTTAEMIGKAVLAAYRAERG